jgi:hypothetical protein
MEANVFIAVAALIGIIIQLISANLNMTTAIINRQMSTTSILKPTTVRRIGLFRKPLIPRIISGTVIFALSWRLYVLSYEPEVTANFVFSVCILFGLLFLSVFSFVVYELTLRASEWIENRMSSAIADIRKEYRSADSELRESIRQSSLKIDETSALAKKHWDEWQRSRRPFGDLFDKEK